MINARFPWCFTYWSSPARIKKKHKSHNFRLLATFFSHISPELSQSDSCTCSTCQPRHQSDGISFHRSPYYIEWYSKEYTWCCYVCWSYALFITTYFWTFCWNRHGAASCNIQARPNFIQDLVIVASFHGFCPRKTVWGSIEEFSYEKFSYSLNTISVTKEIMLLLKHEK